MPYALRTLLVTIITAVIAIHLTGLIIPASARMASNLEGSDEPKKQPLPLPAPPTVDDTTRLDLSSGEATVSLFDRMGPTVVNSDGTLSRISDWAEKSDAEKKTILRVLGKRNQLRLSAEQERLKDQLLSGDGSQPASTTETTKGEGTKAKDEL